MTQFWLRGYAIGYASVTPETAVVTLVTRKSRVRVHERYFLTRVCITNVFLLFASIWKSTRNRVTHVTTVLSRVTAGVTINLLRNQKERVG